MTALRPLTAALALVAAGPVAAAPRVVADIAPVHAIAAAVLGDVAEPDLLIPPGASEHDYALRPSEAATLAEADLVIWVGPSLTPWLEDPLDALAPEAARLQLDSAVGVRRLPIREGGPFEAHVHDQEHADADAHDHDHDQAEAQAEDHGHDHADAEEHSEEHDHAEPAASVDPHVWLDPLNAAAMAEAIAVALETADPENAAAYATNAAAFAAEMDALAAEIAAQLQPLDGKRFIVFHDAYQYFEDRFALPASGSVSLNDAAAPGPQRVSEIRARLGDQSIDCIFAEPQFEPKLIGTLIEGTPTRIGALDPIGAGLTPGADLYPALLRGLADGLVACLAPRS